MSINSCTTLATSQQIEQTQKTMQLAQAGSDPTMETVLVEAFNKAGMSIDLFSSQNKELAPLMNGVRAASKMFMDSLGRDNNERNQLMQKFAQQAAVQIDGHCKLLCQQANVDSMQAYVEKANKLGALMQEASDKNAKSSDFIDRSIQLDEEMVKANNQGSISSAQSTTIRRFWELVTKEGHGVIKTFDERFKSLFMAGIGEWVQETMSSMPTRFGTEDIRNVNLRMAEVFSKDIQTMFLAKRQSLLKELESVSSERDRTLLEYLLLKADLELPPLLNKMNRMQIEAFAKKNDTMRTMETGFQQENRQRLQKHFKESYDADVKFWGEQIATTESETDRKEYEGYLAEAETGHKESLARISRTTVEEDVNACIPSTQSILALQPPETEYERTFMKLSMDEAGIQTLDANTTLGRPEMRLDLSALSVDHFVRREMQNLETRLTAFAKLNRDHAASQMAGRIHVVTT